MIKRYASRIADEWRFARYLWKTRRRKLTHLACARCFERGRVRTKRLTRFMDEGAIVLCSACISPIVERALARGYRVERW